MAEYNEKGEEVPDPTPVESPLRFRQPLSIHDEMRRFIRTELSRQAADQGQESFEEADDFDVDDDDEFVTEYELTEMQEELKFGTDRDSAALNPEVGNVGKTDKAGKRDSDRKPSKRSAKAEKPPGKDEPPGDAEGSHGGQEPDGGDSE